MKKLFGPSKQDSQYDSFIGKHYGVGDLTLIVEDVIAEGGFSFVFLVRDTSKNRVFALKRMLVNSQTDLENCKQEISIMKSFHRHPAMVSFKGHHTKHIGNGIYEVLLLMQHCPNGTVVDLMNQHLSTGFSETLIRQIFTGIVGAVGLMHENGYSHRDLKVENILIGPNKEYVLCDFGSAYKGTLDPESKGHNFVEENINKFTTLAYRAPEMCDMYLGYKIGPAADLWALGVLLYKLCFFTTPFEENTLAIARAKYSIPDADKYSANLISVIRDTLKVNPSDRLTAKQILSRLKNDDSKSKVHVPTPSATTPSSIQSAPSSNKRAQPVQTSHDPAQRQTESAPLNEENSTIKSRSRPRAANKPNEALLIAPPDLTPSRDSGISSRDSVMTSRDSGISSRDSVMTSRDTNDIDTRVKRHSAHSSPQLTSLGDPWGSLNSPVNTNFEECGWSNNPFEPTPTVEDEFLKLSLRDKGNSQSRLDQIVAAEPANAKSAKSSKVARAKTFSHSPKSRPRPVVVKRAAIISQSPGLQQ